MASLSEITGVDKEALKAKFGLEPLYHFDRTETENCVFMSHTLLLDDTELKHGGDLEMRPTKVLGLVTKDILKSKDPSLFEVPEITCLRMGYGKNSYNKEGRMAISKKEADTWLDVFNSLRHSKISQKVQNSVQVEATEDSDDSPFDDTIHPGDSGLHIPQKGSLILLMSILILYARKKSKRKKLNSPGGTYERKQSIGANKISDFLSFWILPYLLNFTQRKVQEIEKHHLARKKDPQTLVKTVKKSAWDIISQATQSKPETESKLKKKLELYFQDELYVEYTLLECDGSPVVLVPLSYVYEENKNPLHLEDIGKKWVSKNGKCLSSESFMAAFVESKDIQLDYFTCMETAKLRTGVDYAIVFPDVGVFQLFFKNVRALSPALTDLQKIESQGRNKQSPIVYHAVVKCSGQNLIVCFTYFQGTDHVSVPALFRAVGAHYFNHFTVVFLHGSNFRRRDSDCKLGNLYHVQAAKRLVFTKRGQLQTAGNEESISFYNGISKFVKFKFPESFKLWEEYVLADGDVKKAREAYGIKPETLDPTQHLKVAFSRNSQKSSLKKACLNKNKKIRNSNLKELLDQDIKAANLDGCLFSTLCQHGRRDNIGVTLAIGNTLMPEDPPTVLKKAMNKIIYYFVMVILNAGLRRVFPSAPGEEGEDEEGHTGYNQMAIPDAPMERNPEDKEDSDTGDKDVSRAMSSKQPRVSAGRESGSDDDDDDDDNDKDGDDECLVSSGSESESDDGVDDGDDDDNGNDDDNSEDEMGEEEDGDDSNSEEEEEAEVKASSSHASASVTYPPKGASQNASKKTSVKRKAKPLAKILKQVQSKSSSASGSEAQEGPAPKLLKVSSAEPEDGIVTFREGKPTDRELDDLAGKIGSVWKKLGIHLGIERHVLDEIEANAEDKPLQMLLRWTNTTSSDTPFRDLYEALCSDRIGQNNLAKTFCCKETK